MPFSQRAQAFDFGAAFNSGAGLPNPLQGFSMLVKGFEPVIKAATRSNIETMSYLSRRTRAALDASARLARCHAPQELASEAVQVTREAAEDLRATSQLLLSLWSSAFMLPTVAFNPWASSGLGGSPAADAKPAAPQQSHAAMRDVITFPDPKSGRRSATTE